MPLPMAVPMIVITVAATLFTTSMVVTVVVAVVTPVPLLLFAIARDILALVPVVAHEIDLLAASAVFVAVLAPVPGVAGRDVQIERWLAGRYALDGYWLRIDEDGRGKTADIEAAIEARLADIHRHTDVSCLRLGAKGAGRDGEGEQEAFHDLDLFC